MASCIGCGAALGPGATTCSACGTKAKSSQLAAKVPLLANASPNVPQACCCCLGAPETTSNVQVYVAPRQFFFTKVPWCRRCLSRSRRTVALLVVMMFGVAFGGIGVVRAATDESSDAVYGIMAAVFIGGLVLGGILAQLLAKLGDAPGHVSRCQAVGSLPNEGFNELGVPGGTLTFHNAAFAKRWREANPE